MNLVKVNPNEQEWLEECRTASTKDTYKRHLDTFKQWYGKSLNTFLALEPREMRHTAIKFQNDALNGWKTRHGRTLKANSIIGTLTALQSYCTYMDKPLVLRGKKVKPTMDLTSHAFSDADLRRMFNVAGTQEKALLATLCSLGWEVSSIIALERLYIANLIFRAQEQQSKFIYFVDQRKKTGAIRLGVLNPLAIEWISEWLKVPIEVIAHSKGPARWDSKRLFSYISTKGVSVMIKRLAREAHVTVTGRVHTHTLRKWVMSGLSRAGFNEFQIKFLLGKAIPLSDMTYLQTLQQEVEARYPQAYADYLNISGKKQALPINAEDMDSMLYMLRKFKEGKIRIEP